MFFSRKNSKTRILFVVLLSSIFISLPIYNSSTAQINENILDAIDSHVVNEVMKKYVLAPGTSLGIIYNNETVYLKGYGEAAKDTTMTPDTPLILGSVSKSFTALAIIQLNESGQLNLDDSVQDHIPWFTTQNDNYASQITIRHLIHHLSGFYRERDSTKNISLEETVRTSEMDKHLGPPGSLYHYNNFNYQILGYIVEVVSNQSFSAYIKTNIFDPLNMTNSFLSEYEAKKHGLAQGYVLAFGIPIAANFIHSLCWNPCSNIISSAEDLTHYMIALMNEGKYGNNSILSPEGMKVLWSKYEFADQVENYYAYAMGWNNFTMDDTEYIRHSGRAKNFLAEVIMTPKEGWGVVILHNSHSELRAMHQTDIGGWNIMRILLDQPVWLEKLSMKGFFIILDFAYLIMIVGLGIIPFILLRRRIRKLRNEIEEVHKMKKMNLIGIILSYIAGIFILIPLTGIVSNVLSDHWLWFWNKEIWDIPDLVSVSYVIALLFLGLGVYWSFQYFKGTRNNEEKRLDEEN